MELIKEVIIAFVKNRAVRIVHPLRGSGDVKNGTRKIGLRLWGGGLDGGCRPRQRFVGRFALGSNRY